MRELVRDMEEDVVKSPMGGDDRDGVKSVLTKLLNGITKFDKQVLDIGNVYLSILPTGMYLVLALTL